ncbi:MAG: hypothetical protein AAB699_02550, partial [Patescibacteria group bacterium]
GCPQHSLIFGRRSGYAPELGTPQVPVLLLHHSRHQPPKNGGFAVSNRRGSSPKERLLDL